MESTYVAWYAEKLGRPLYRKGLEYTGGSRIGGLIGAHTPCAVAKGIVAGVGLEAFLENATNEPQPLIALAGGVAMTAISYAGMVPFLNWLAKARRDMHREERTNEK